MPCSRGHVDYRLRSNNMCRSCSLEKMQRERTENPDRHSARFKAWRDKNRDREVARHAAWRTENPEKHAEASARWRRNNLDAVRANNNKRRARLLQAEGHFTADDIERITKVQGGKCADCRKRRKLTIDHIVPLTKGGTNWPRNVQMLCRPCNSSKCNRDPIEHAQNNGKLL